jgi:hypothetical protein
MGRASASTDARVLFGASRPETSRTRRSFRALQAMLKRGHRNVMVIGIADLEASSVVQMLCAVTEVAAIVRPELVR